jgi:hypothetical protein
MPEVAIDGQLKLKREGALIGTGGPALPRGCISPQLGAIGLSTLDVVETTNL